MVQSLQLHVREERISLRTASNRRGLPCKESRITLLAPAQLSMSCIRLSVTQLSCLLVRNSYISALAISIDADSMHGFYFTLPFTILISDKCFRLKWMNGLWL